MPRRTIVVSLLVVGAGAITFFVGFSRPNNKPAAEKERIVHAERRRIGAVVNATGVVRLRVGSEVRVGSQLSGIVKKLNVTPEESPTSQSLKSDGKMNLTKLRGLIGAAFDKAYIDNEVTYHESVIKALDDTLIPNAKNSELKALLESGRPIFESHLNHAKGVQTSLQ